MNLGKVFEITVNNYPDNIALVEGVKYYKYSELNEEINRLASSLKKLGIKKGDRVAVLLKNQKEIVIIFWAVQKLGAIFVPLNYRLSPKEIQFCLNDTNPKVIFYNNEIFDGLDEIKANKPSIIVGLTQLNCDINFWDLILKGTSDFYTVECNDDEIAVVLYIQGSTGFLKGVPLTHKNEYLSTLEFIDQHHYISFESTLGVMPLYLSMGIRTILSIVFLNGKYVIISSNFDSNEALTLITKEKISSLYMYPSFYYELLNDPNFYNFDLYSLKKISYSGAPMSEILIIKCIQLLKPDYFINHYGCTEISNIASCSLFEKTNGCVGKPSNHQKIRLVKPGIDEELSPETTVKTGELGEIVVHAADTFKEYWNLGCFNEKTFQNNWFFTGDLGYMDNENYLYIVGRVDNMIVSNGEKIFPEEIEKVLISNCKVSSAAVIGEEDRQLGQIIVAIVVPNDFTLTIQELDYYCKKHLSSYKRPRKYKIVMEVPQVSKEKIEIK